MLKRKFNFNPKPVSKKFNNFKVIPKSKRGLKALVNKNDALKKTFNAVFSKKGLAVAATGTAIGAGVASVWNYIESNSGCFKKRIDGSVCKYKEFSCCQKDSLDNVDFCEGSEKLTNVCDNFDEEKEKTCCRLCDCKYGHCLPNETMQCQRPTVADALNHFASQIGSTVWSGFEAIFPWVRYLIYGIIVLFAFWIVNLIQPFAFGKKKDV